MTQPLMMEQTRGPGLESRHRVHALWVDEKGREMQSWGDIDLLVCPRSSFKLFQALPYVLSKAFDQAPDPTASIALSMASHAGEEVHTQFVQSWLKKLGFAENDLICGPQWPKNPERIWEMAKQNRRADRISNNCSGKHTGMLATCQASGFTTKDYHHWDHPLQVRIRQIAGRLGGFDLDQAAFGTDGCGLPIYFLPMSSFARMGAHYLNPEKSEFSEAILRIRQAWRQHPIMVGGSQTLDTRLAQVTNGRVLAKIGAQGNYIALDFERGRCLVFKIENGSDTVREKVLMDFLVEAGCLSAQEEKELRVLFPREIDNWDGQVVGKSRLMFPSAGKQDSGFEY